ncbi:GntR family transcriptional regulator [Natranaerovirga hydrolytica]|uniref:GntR family transcriptional regulator n=1 Tax=Natranaerovirga hydrolytica TaxID=680378 RepID=A0A4R1MKW0_9FIRM|nr:GntR family transcriptional regulator [Natranaerovirga hydrolytica]TCK93488.1 GntR family transcriptional regulator [Natranaerovirga hydrolytica]
MKWDITESMENKSVSEYVYEVIKNNIVSFNVKPGERISENEISERLDVSRTPVRETFIKLAQEDLVYVLPQRGTYVSYIDLDQVEEARFIRESLEKSVIELATQTFSETGIMLLEQNLEKQRNKIKNKAYGGFLELDEEFHRLIFKECKKERTWSVIQQVNSQYKRVRVLSFIANINWEQTIDQHKNIIKAIKNKDNNLAQKVMKEHLNKLIIEKIELKKQYPEYFK